MCDQNEVARLRAELARANERNMLVEQRAGELITEARGRIAALEAENNKLKRSLEGHIAIMRRIQSEMEYYSNSTAGVIARKVLDGKEATDQPWEGAQSFRERKGLGPLSPETQEQELDDVAPKGFATDQPDIEEVNWKDGPV